MIKKYKFTDSFLNEVLRKRPYLKKEWCYTIIENPIKVEEQESNRFRFWGKIEGIDIDNASKKILLKQLSINKLPFQQEILTA